jgi:uncharacterized protein
MLVHVEDRDVPFRFRPLPIALVAALGLGLPYVAYYAAIFTGWVAHLPLRARPLAWLYVHHFYQLVLALVAIAILRRFRPFDPNLRLPPGKSYVPAAIGWGILFGVLMTVVDYAPQLWAHRPPHLGFPLTTGNIVGWTLFEGVYVGPTEEVPFRSLLVGYLIAAMPGTVRFRGYRMSWAGIIVAAIFAVAHIDNFIQHPSWATFGQQIYAFALGVLYAYWFERSRSIVAPIIGHNVGDVVEYGICFVLIYCWT